MLTNYLKISIRNLFRNREYAIINLLGLSVGLATAILVFQYIIQEVNYDRFHSKADRIYRLTYTHHTEDQTSSNAKLPFPVKHTLLPKYSEIADITRLYSNHASNKLPLLRVGEKQFHEERFYFADPNVFEVFDFELIRGNPQKALEEPFSILLTEKMAQKYFGNEDPIGKEIEYENKFQLKVTGIIGEVPNGSHIHFDFLAPIEMQRRFWGGHNPGGYDLETDWNWAGAWIYVLLKSPDHAEGLAEKLPQYVEAHFEGVEPNELELHLQPLTSIHLHSDLGAEVEDNGSTTQLWIFGTVAALILLIACINYMNLATAVSSRRAREVGVRKVLGAGRFQIMAQFLTEAIVISGGALILSGLLSELMLPLFNELTGAIIELHLLDQPLFLLALIGMAVITGILSGVYPAFLLSAFRPIQTLKNSLYSGSGGWLRKILVTTQFSVTMTLGIILTIVYLQLTYMENKDLGFEKEQVMVIPMQPEIQKQFANFKQKLESYPEIHGVTMGNLPGQRGWTNSFQVEGKPTNEPVRMAVRYVGPDYFEFMDIQIKEGRGFTDIWKQDSASFILNEAAVKFLGWEGEAIGKTMSFTGGQNNNELITCKIVGVAEDYHFESLYKSIQPMIIRPTQWSDIAVKLNGTNLSETLAVVENTWAEFAPAWPFEYSFLDENLSAQYIKEEKLGKSIQLIGITALIIACMGLFGLVSFIVERRKKEISIRKILGATAGQIVVLLSRGFASMIVVAFVIAIPLAWYMSEQWLQNFAYRTEFSFWPVLLIGGLAMLAALITISYHSFKATLIDPATMLREE